MTDHAVSTAPAVENPPNFFQRYAGDWFPEHFAEAEPNIPITIFKNHAARSAKRVAMSLPELRRQVLDTSAGEKSDLPWLKLAAFGNERSDHGSLRHDANVLSISGVEADYDGEQLGFDSAVELLRRANVMALIYTSPSHQDEAPRWRVLCPASRALPPAERERLVARLNGLLGGMIARESFTLSQSYFYGSVNGNPDHDAEIVHGDYIDLRDDLDAGAIWSQRHEDEQNGNRFTAIGERQTANQPIDVLAMLRDMQSGENVHDSQLRASASLLVAGMEEDEVVEMILDGTKKLDEAEGWDWVEEERRLRGMCTDWLRKHPRRSAFAMADLKEAVKRANDGGVRLEDFRAYMPSHSYFFLPTREPWPASSVDARLPKVPVLTTDGKHALDAKGKPLKVNASRWLDKHAAVEQMTWAPGQPMLIRDRLIADGGFIERRGVTILNLYRPPAIELGDATWAQPWIDHVRKVYPEHADHIIKWLAHRVQHPGEKINHALVLGGDQGIGKDTLLDPVKQAVGPWNFIEASPKQTLGRFNGFLKSVILRISEARDTGGEGDRFQFYEHLKTYTAAPPDVLRVDEKNLREYSIPNICGVVLTTNRKDSIYLPADDRRHYVAWSNLTRDAFNAHYWAEIWSWYERGGHQHVAAYLAQLDLSNFNSKAPPPKTDVFWQIVEVNRTTECSEFGHVLHLMDNPIAVTLPQIAEAARTSSAFGPSAAFDGDFFEWLTDRKNRRVIPHRMEDAGYVPVRNETRQDGLWKVGGKPQVIYARKELPFREQHAAATELARTLVQ